MFDINMPLLYGERGKAFIRLQEEIGRRSPDQSLLAWVVHPNGTGKLALKSQLNFPRADAGLTANILATHPSQFRFSGSVRPYRNAWSLQKYEVTNWGVRMTTSKGRAGELVIDPALAETYSIWYAFLNCYEHDVINQLAIPVIMAKNGTHHYHYCRLALPAAYVLSLNELANTQPSRKEGSSAYRMEGDYDSQSLFITQSSSAPLELVRLPASQLSQSSREGSSLVFVLRESNLELHDVDSPQFWSTGRRNVLECVTTHCPTATIFTMLFENCRRQKLVVLSIDYDRICKTNEDPVEYSIHVFPFSESNVDLSVHHETFRTRSRPAKPEPGNVGYRTRCVGIGKSSQVHLFRYTEVVLAWSLPGYECSFDVWADDDFE